MNEWRLLTRLELYALFGINKLRHTRDRKEKSRGRLLLGVWLFLAVLFMGYVAGYVFLLTTLGLSEAVPLFLSVLASLVVFLFGIFKAGSTLFGGSGYDLLASMPLSPRAVVLSRLCVLYIEDFLFSLAVLLPGFVTYGILCRPSAVFWVLSPFACLLLPLIPMVASALFGTLVMALTARMKHKSLLQALFAVVLMAGLSVVPMLSVDVSEDAAEDFMAGLLARLSDLLGRIYPPAARLSESMQGGSPVGFVLFAALSLALTAVCVLVASCLFTRILQGLSAVRARHDYTVGEMQSRPLLGTLYTREAKRYFSSGIYVSNTIMGPLLGVVLSVVLCVTGVESIEAALSAAVPVRTLLPLALAAVMCMMTTTSVAVSMEGKQMDTVKSLPIPTGVWLDSKLLVYLTLTLPCLLVAEVLMTIATRPSPLAFLGGLLLPLSVILFSGVIGLAVNLKFHSFDWPREEVPVKQSLSALLGGFAGVLLALALGGILCVVPAGYREYASLVLAAGVAVVSLLLRRRNRGVRVEML